MLKKSFNYLVAILIVTVLLYTVNLGELWAVLSPLTLNNLIALFALSIILILVSALKWKIFLDHFGSTNSLFKLFKLYLLGYFVNQYLPSHFGGDIARSWFVGKNFNHAQALAATILERYTGMLAMLTLALIFMWSVAVVTWQIQLVIILLTVGLIVLTILAISKPLVSRVARIKGIGKISSSLLKIQEAFTLAAKHPSLLLKTLLLSFVYHSLTVLNTLVAAWAVGWLNPDMWSLFVVLPIILLISALPITPSGLGIQEGAFYFFLHGLGATPAQALGVALILRAKTYVISLIGGLVWLQLRKESKLQAQMHT